MRVGVTMRVVEAPSYTERRDAISHDCIHWLSGMQHTPLLIPNCLPEPVTFLDEYGIQAVVLTSGNDVVPRPEGCEEIAPERDYTEFEILRYATSRRIPVLGICRGMHIINRFFGGSVVADCRTQHLGAIDHVATEHAVELDASFRDMASAQQIITNSFHNQAVASDGVGAGLKAFARCTGDGLVEGLIHGELPILAIQWHPERPNPAAAFDKAIVDKLFNDKWGAV